MGLSRESWGTGGKWLVMGGNVREWVAMVGNGGEWFEMVGNGGERVGMVENGWAMGGSGWGMVRNFGD